MSKVVFYTSDIFVDEETNILKGFVVSMEGKRFLVDVEDFDIPAKKLDAKGEIYDVSDDLNGMRIQEIIPFGLYGIDYIMKYENSARRGR